MIKTFFDYENEFLLSNCVWSLNFVALRLLHYKILLFLSILLNHKCYFLLFFFVPKLLLFYHFLKEYFLWKIINSICDWCIIYPHFVSYKKINDQHVTTIQMSKNSQKLSHIYEHVHNIFPTITENKFIVWNYSFLGLTGIYLFEFSYNNSRIKCKICSKLLIKAPDIVLVSLWLTLNIFDMLLLLFLFLWGGGPRGGARVGLLNFNK